MILFTSGTQAMFESLPKADNIDILLLLEGTYPFVSGGVSSWVHQLIELFPQHRFGAVFLGGQQADYRKMEYTPPKNFVHLECHFLFEQTDGESSASKPADQTHFDELVKFHDYFKQLETANYSDLAKQLINHFSHPNHVTLQDFLHGKLSWQYIIEQYQTKCPHISFTAFFWAIRNIHMPIFKIIHLVNQLPQAKVIHSVSTGYAGFLGALIASQRACPYILTEHGIYIKERKIDLMQSKWLKISHFNELRDRDSLQYLTNLWIRTFEILGRFCYATASPIISLFPAYQAQQIHYGADPENTHIIPNGINTVKFKKTAKDTPNQTSPIIGLIARVVPIKDVKNFIRSMVFVLEVIPEATAWIIGAINENEDYFHECEDLINVLGLNQKIIFKGKQKTEDIFQEIDLLVLSSISEGLPLVILESFSCGIPVVATNVGACEELIQGATVEDQALGAGGIVVEISNSAELARGVIELITQPERWQQAQATILKRVHYFYNETLFKNDYEAIYEKAFSLWQASDSNLNDFSEKKAILA